MKCTRCNGPCGTFGHWQRFCVKTRTPAEWHHCCPEISCTPVAAEALPASGAEGSE